MTLNNKGRKKTNYFGAFNFRLFFFQFSWERSTFFFLPLCLSDYVEVLNNLCNWHTWLIFLPKGIWFKINYEQHMKEKYQPWLFTLGSPPESWSRMLKFWLLLLENTNMVKGIWCYHYFYFCYFVEESTYDLELEVEFLPCLSFVMIFGKAFTFYHWSFLIYDNVRVPLRVVRLSYMTVPSIHSTWLSRYYFAFLLLRLFPVW